MHRSFSIFYTFHYMYTEYLTEKVNVKRQKTFIRAVYVYVQLYFCFNMKGIFDKIILFVVMLRLASARILFWTPTDDLNGEYLQCMILTT